MKTMKIIKKINSYFDKDSRLKNKQKKKLKELLRKLSEQQKKLEKKSALENSEQKQKEIERELKIIHIQREKALELLAEMKTPQGN